MAGNLSVGFYKSRYPLVGIMTIMLMLTLMLARISTIAMSRPLELMVKMSFRVSISMPRDGAANRD
ncbi:MAG TPA: hypothetical protein PLK77_08100 [Pyrinomonadaceae bacterium]|nr:hypothetical protein [Pyrinomonadaceae bacterium]